MVLVIRENKNMKQLFLFITFFGLMAVGCHMPKQAQQSVKADTVTTASPGVVLHPVDSSGIITQQLSEVINTPLEFTTFYGRLKANFNSPQASGNATVYIKMQKDSIIWMSITGPLNSVKIINKVENSVQLSSIAHLQEITKLPFTFNDFQNIILGKPVINNSSNVNYEIKKDSINIIATGELLQYIYSFTKKDFKLGQSNFQTLSNSSVTGANIFYNNYHTTNNINFSASRDIAVTGPSPANLQVNFKEYNFNQPQTFVFTISKNYTIKYE